MTVNKYYFGKKYSYLKLLFGNPILGVRDAFKKNIAEKETLVHMGGRGVKIIPFF